MTPITQNRNLEAITSEIIAAATAKNREIGENYRRCGQANCAGHPIGREDFGRHLPGDIPEILLARLLRFAETELHMTVKFDWWNIYPHHLGETIIMGPDLADGEDVRDLHVKPRMSEVSTFWILTHEIIHVVGGDQIEMPANNVIEEALAEVTHMENEIRAQLGAFIVMKALGITAEAERDELDQLAVAAGPLGGGKLLAVRSDAIAQASQVLNVLGV